MKRIVRSKSFLNQDVPETSSPCKCERPSKNILCRLCGHVFRVNYFNYDMKENN